MKTQSWEKIYYINPIPIMELIVSNKNYTV